MKANQLVIGSLLATAMVLGGFLLNGKPQAHASMVETKSDYTLMTSGPANDEMLVIIDSRNQKLIAYRMQNDKLNPVASGRLDQLFPVKRP